MILAQSVYTCKDTIITCAIEKQSLGKYLRGALPNHYPLPAIPSQAEWIIEDMFVCIYNPLTGVAFTYIDASGTSHDYD